MDAAVGVVLWDLYSSVTGVAMAVASAVVLAATATAAARSGWFPAWAVGVNWLLAADLLITPIA